jgi:hypothetical protein
VKKISKLTANQETRLVEFREEWLRIGLSCEPADFEKGDEIITGFYRRLNKPKPIILHFSSPAMCELAVNFVFAALGGPSSEPHSELNSKLNSKLYNELNSKLYRELHSKLGSNLDSKLNSKLYNELNSKLYSELHSKLDSNLDSKLYRELHSELHSKLDSNLDSKLYRELRRELHSKLDSNLNSKINSKLYRELHSKLGSNLDSKLNSKLYNELNSKLYSELHSKLGSNLDSKLYRELHSELDSELRSIKSYFRSNCWGAGHWCAWEAFYLFGHEIGAGYKAEDIALLLEWAGLSKSIGWWAPWDGICFVSDRPRGIHFDDQNRLHCETGMAAHYSDGWGCYSWHGTAIPGEWIEEKKSLTPKIALTTKNMEQRRAAIEILGWHKILNELGGKVIDENHPHIGRLIEVTLPDLEKPARFNQVLCGTGREFAYGVPYEINTAREAQAWRDAKSNEEWTEPEIRT